jgi:AAA+ ATPase superfamily predicted ATPase
MFVKRTAELKLLEEQYASPRNNLVVLYGRKGMGKTTLLTEFLEGKSATFYYEGTECVDKLQLIQMHRRLTKTSTESEQYGYPELFSEFIGMQEEKTIIVLDEIHYIIKNSPDFVDAFQLLHNVSRPVMFVLCSSSIKWAENEMIGSLGTFVSYITAYVKMKEFTFVDFVNRFPKSTVETCININAILGGIPEYLDDWQESRSVKDNINHILLDKNSRLFMAPQQFLKLELREPAVYNTILYTLAEGNRKLNDLHTKTGFSRAKISVYLKNLIQLDLVEKLIPVNAKGKENVQKGLYRIKDNFLNFWYRFVFPNLSDLMLGKTEKVYENEIAPYLNNYLGEYFADVCTEFLKLMNLHLRLPEKFLWWDRWYGKNGTIDILAQSENKKALVGKCLWEERKAEISDYEKLISLAGEAGVDPNYCYLFSKGGFTQELREAVSNNSNIMLIGLEDL